MNKKNASIAVQIEIKKMAQIKEFGQRNLIKNQKPNSKKNENSLLFFIALYMFDCQILDDKYLFLCSCMIFPFASGLLSN